MILISLFTLCLFRNNLTVSASSNDDNLVSVEKIYSNTDIEENFDDSSLIVIIDRINSGINKSHESTIFKDIEFLEIIDLTYVNDITTITDTANFEQILKIRLIESGKAKVIEMINRLSLIDGIKYAGPNKVFEIERMPNDPLYSPISSVNGQWCHNTLQSENAWNFTTGSSNVRIGVIDTGISNHTDLVDNLAPGLDFFNMVDGEPGVARTDSDGHGTHVAGIIGAVGNQTTATGVVGVNWDVTIVPMQVANNTGGISSAACVSAINYARKIWNTEERISVLSMSIGGYGEWPEIETAIRNYQCLFVCSTGNRELNNDGTLHHYPSFYGSDMHTDPLPNMISVGRSDINDSRPIDANWGNRTIMLYAPGQHILSTYPEELSGAFVGYYYSSGSSMATPQVSGVAALLLSINSNLTTQQLRTAILESVDIPNVGGLNPLENLCVTDGRLNAYNAVRYVLEHFSNTEYTLSNYSSSVNTNKSIVSGDSYFNNKNGFYKLNVTYAKNYEFNISSNQNLNVILYDEDFNEISYADFDSSNNKTHFIQNFSVGTYYLRTQYENEEASGTINTKINSRTTTYLNYGNNDILLNTYNDIVDYYYINERGAGFFGFTIDGTKADGTTVSLPASALKIYSESGKLIPMDKFTVTGVSNAAQNKSGENSIIIYLPRNGYFYLDIDVSSTNLKSLKIIVSPVESQDINLFELNEDINSTVSVLNNTDKGDYIEELNIEQSGKFTIYYYYSGGLINDFMFLLVKQNYDSTTGQYSLSTKIVQLMNGINDSFTYTGNLEAGKYYIGYLNKNDVDSVITTFERHVTLSGGEVLITDPDRQTLCGSQISIIEMNSSNKSYRGTFITKNFTRIIYPNYNYGISPSRLDYYWYSSNESVAEVTEFGTVLGKNVGSIKIMAVLKSDPSKVFVKEFTVINDTGTKRLIVHSTIEIKLSEIQNGEFQLPLEKATCPFPRFQDYNWTLTITCDDSTYSPSYDQWGVFTANGAGCFTLIGSYQKNTRVIVIIDVVIVDE